ncbi:MAG: NAD(P)/FAD-dependent oxidoreductase [Saprospirales bacterium]|nr:MAG: NAD(P)/FAD-dependent oxidoreductase [Saprospirales bacterium]
MNPKGKNIYDAAFIGGGAASFFAAIQYADLKPQARCVIIEKGKNLLNKVRISGGGRCNVTNTISMPAELVKNYPRGEKELLGPFHQFSSQDTVEWFESRGVKLKTESDGRIFPVSDSSSSIIDCLMNEVRKKDIAIVTGENITDISFSDEKEWELKGSSQNFNTKLLFLGSGSSPAMWKMLESKLGLKIIPPVPSLFTFNIKDPRIKDLPGISLKEAEVFIRNSKLQSNGPLLITHWGMSGPAILKLSAWGARELAEKKYQFEIAVNWIADFSPQDFITDNRKKHPSALVINHKPEEIPSRLWKSLFQQSGIDEKKKWADLNKAEMLKLEQMLSESVFKVNGKSTFKEEFVTAGGIDLKEVDLKKFSLKKYPTLFLAGEVLNIDAITGGFNFQAAWTGGWIAGTNMAYQEH